MAIDNIPTYQELVDRNRADVASNLPSVDPTIFGSIIRALCDAQAGRAKDFFDALEQLLKQCFPQTSEGEFLELWASYEDLTRNAAEVASGNIVFTGTIGTVIPIDTEVSSADGNTYLTDSALTLANQSISITSLTRSGTLVTATTSSDHNLASGLTMTIANASGSEYNGDFEITVTDSDEFTYTITGSPTTPDPSSTITADYDGGYVAVTSEDAGDDQNLSSGGQLTILTPQVGVDSNQYVCYGGLSGGTDEESDDDLLSRVLQSRQNPVANFNETAIEKQARTVAGVTRVKIYPITPEVGDVTIYFLRDNDDNIIPDAGEIADVKAAIVEIMPANTDSDDVHVSAPSASSIDFTFSAISPSTTTMKTAIENNLNAFFEDEVDIGENVSQEKYESIIINTIDPETGDELDSFTLSTPSTDLSVGDGGILTLGTVSY